MNGKDEKKDWVIIIGMSTLGTIMALISWLSSPQGQQIIQNLVRM